MLIKGTYIKKKKECQKWRCHPYCCDAVSILSSITFVTHVRNEILMGTTGSAVGVRRKVKEGKTDPE